MKASKIFDDYFWGFLVSGVFVPMVVKNDLPFVVFMVVMVGVYLFGHFTAYLFKDLLRDN